MTITDDLLQANAEHADTYTEGALAMPPARPVAVVACMDADVEADVRQSVARIQASPFIPHENVRGFVFDVATGKLDEVT